MVIICGMRNAECGMKTESSKLGGYRVSVSNLQSRDF